MNHIVGNLKWVNDLFWTFNTHYRPWNGTETGIFIAVVLISTGLMLSLLKKKKIVWSQFIAVFFIIMYLGFLASSMLFLRPITEEPMYNLTPFWSWKEAFNGDSYLTQEIIMNVVVMIPVGFIMPIVFPHSKYIIWVSLALGIVISGTIELIQLTCHLGLFEWDDIIHNSLGCMLGCMMMCGLRKMVPKTRS